MFIPSIDQLKNAEKLMNFGESGNKESYDVIRKSSLNNLTMLFCQFMFELEQVRKTYKDYYGFDPLEPYKKTTFDSKEEFLCYMGKVSDWLYHNDMSSLTSMKAMNLISYHYGTTEYAFFCRFS